MEADARPITPSLCSDCPGVWRCDGGRVCVRLSRALSCQFSRVKLNAPPWIPLRGGPPECTLIFLVAQFTEHDTSMTYCFKHTETLRCLAGSYCTSGSSLYIKIDQDNKNEFGAWLRGIRCTHTNGVLKCSMEMLQSGLPCVHQLKPLPLTLLASWPT